VVPRYTEIFTFCIAFYLNVVQFQSLKKEIFLKLCLVVNLLSIVSFVLGDYPLPKFWYLTEKELNFNHRHASARVVVERAFGLLKQKCRRLKRFEIRNLEYGILSIVVCIVLHNFILLDGDEPAVS